MIDVLFPILPFAALSRPSIGVSLLKAGLAREGFSARVRYFNLDFAAMLGLAPYRTLVYAFDKNALVGEWVFAAAAFAALLPEAEAYLADILRPSSPDWLRAKLP